MGDSGIRSVTRLRLFGAFVVVALTIIVGLVVWADGSNRRWQTEDRPHLERIVTRLGLTDLALWTEARYTRHPSQTDRFSAFQDFPAAPEHFPAGSIVPPPPALAEPVPVAAPVSPGGFQVDRGDRRRLKVGAPENPTAQDPPAVGESP